MKVVIVRGRAARTEVCRPRVKLFSRHGSRGIYMARKPAVAGIVRTQLSRSYSATAGWLLRGGKLAFKRASAKLGDDGFPGVEGKAEKSARH